MKKLIFICLLLAGCDTLPERQAPVVTEVKVPVAVSCVGDLPKPPKVHSNRELLALKDEYDFVTAIHADRVALDAYRVQLEAVLEGCR